LPLQPFSALNSGCLTRAKRTRTDRGLWLTWLHLEAQRPTVATPAGKSGLLRKAGGNWAFWACLARPLGCGYLWDTWHMSHRQVKRLVVADRRCKAPATVQQWRLWSHARARNNRSPWRWGYLVVRRLSLPALPLACCGFRRRGALATPLPQWWQRR